MNLGLRLSVTRIVASKFENFLTQGPLMAPAAAASSEVRLFLRMHPWCVFVLVCLCVCAYVAPSKGCLELTPLIGNIRSHFVCLNEHLLVEPAAND